MLHPKKLISRNYHHMEANPVLANLFPRENLIGGTRRLKNLSELLSPTVQTGAGGAGDDTGQDAAGDRWNGSYHCTMVDGADIAPGREVAVDGSRYGSASTRNVKFTPAHIF